MAVGILAYGSLVDDPGEEISRLTAHLIDSVCTPFAVEYARASRTRAGAPTLVPVGEGGSRVRARVLVMHPQVDLAAVSELLVRRESRLETSRAPWVRTIPGFAGIDACVYSALAPNIRPLSAARLADLAITSASGRVGASRLDGISYLAQQRRRGVDTPLSGPYEAAILARTRSSTLAEAWAISCRGGDV